MVIYVDGVIAYDDDANLQNNKEEAISDAESDRSSVCDDDSFEEAGRFDAPDPTQGK